MEILLFYFCWMLGFVCTGVGYFAPRLIKPFDQYGIPVLVATFWPIGLPIYLLVKHSKSR